MAGEKTTAEIPAELSPSKKLLLRLRACAEIGDKESAHVAADEALLKYVRETTTYSRARVITETYNSIEKWYA